MVETAKLLLTVYIQSLGIKWKHLLLVANLFCKAHGCIIYLLQLLMKRCNYKRYRFYIKYNASAFSSVTTKETL